MAYMLDIRNRLPGACAIVLSLAFTPCALAVESTEIPANEIQIGNRITDSQTGENDSKIVKIAGYDKNSDNGFFFNTKDESFSLNIGAYTQARYDLNWRDTPTDDDIVEEDFYFNITSLYFIGQLTRTFDYHLRMNYDDEGKSDLQIAYLQYNINDQWTLRAGQQFVAISREDWMFPQDLLTTDFSANDATFAYGAPVAIQSHYEGKKQRFWAALSDAAIGGKVQVEKRRDTTLTGRWEYQVSGRDWSIWDDIVGRRGRSKGILLGLAGVQQPGENESGSGKSAQLNVDLSFNGDGYQVMIDASLTRLEPRHVDSFINYGILAQGGYFFTTHLQAYTQFDLVSPGDQPGELEIFHSITAGVNYFPFPWRNRWKFSLEVAHMFDIINKTIVEPSRSLGWQPSDEKGQTYLRLQAQFGF